MSPPVVVENLRKVFKVPVRDSGLRQSVKSVVRREHREVVAVDGVSFQLGKGEIVGFLGPNGAGKTTTIKMLTGLLFPDGGDARVLGFQPWRRSKDLLRRVALVMGQRNNLQWDLPAADSFDLNRAIYGIPETDYRKRVTRFTELLEVADLMTKPVRNLSLGERMKMEIAAALLHAPEVLFLDEPTIGLDVSMQKRLRLFIADYARETGATVLLTSHYMADVEALCERVVVIHRGSILHDGDLSLLLSRFSTHKTVGVTALDLPDDLTGYGTVISRTPERAVIEIPHQQVSTVASRLLAAYTVTDLTIEDPPLEEVIDRVFSSPDGHP